MTDSSIPPTQLAETITDHWGLPLEVTGCTQCKQIFLIEESDLGKSCPYCMRGNLEAQPGYIRIEPPELVIPFQIGRDQPDNSANSLLPTLSKFTQGIWLHAKDFNSNSLYQHSRRVFMPMWLVDSTLSGNWEAETGFDYQVESSHDNYAGGEWKTQEVIETRIRWEPRLGQLKRPYDNIAVPGISDHHQMQQLVGGFHLEKARPYQKDLINNSLLRNPDLQTDEVFPLAQSYLKNVAAEDCRLAAGAQHIRNFIIEAEYESLHWTQLLLPFYSTYYTDDLGNQQLIWINGETGKIAGPCLASQQKGWIWAGISAAVALFCFMFAFGCFALTALFPPLAVVGTVLVFAAILAGLFAIVPAVYPWIWNRKQLDPKIHG